MNGIEKYRNGEVVNSEFSDYQGSMEDGASLVKPVLNRWYIVAGVFALVCAVGLAGMWFIVKPGFVATAAIRVAPVIPSILSGEGEGVPMYKNFMHTQADLITSDKVLQRVADDLIDRDLMFFNGNTEESFSLSDKLRGVAPRSEPVAKLRDVLTSEKMLVTAEDETELIKISMKGGDAGEVAEIVNSFVRAYMAIVVSEETKDGDRKLAVLEDERQALTEKLHRQRQAIREMADEFGTQSLTTRQEMMMQRVADLQAELTRYQMTKIGLQAREKMLEQSKQAGISPEDTVKLRHEFINADLMVQTLTANTALLEQELVAAEQELAPTNPQLDRKRQLLATIRGRMAERSEEVGRDFDEMVKNELAKSEKYELVNVKAELEQISLYEHQVRELLRGQDEETIELGRKQLTMMDMQEQMELTKDIYDTVRRRIQELEMERKRPARISVAYFANIIPGKSNRTKYAGAVLFAGLGLGVCLAWLRDKSDQRLRTPEDVERRVGIRIVGTTTNSGQIRKAVQSKQMLEEYQTICTNLGLYEEGIPGRVVVTSPGPREGKTTLAINLATSLAKMGKRVLLIDGDLRKPEIGKLLRIEHPRDGLGDIMSGKDIRESVCLGSQRGLFILTSAACAVGSIYEMITQRRMVEFLASTARTFDHVVIDSPPILAVPDCLLWAKMCDGVMLASIAGRTASPELREAYMRLSQMEIKILGMVLNNVSISRSYNPYGYGYYTGSTCRSSNGGMRRRNMLLPMQRSRIKRDENLVKG